MWTGPVAYMGTQEWMIIGAIVLVLFGGAKLSQLGKGLGEGIREFKKSMDGSEDAEGGKKGEDSPKNAEGGEPSVTVVK